MLSVGCIVSTHPYISLAAADLASELQGAITVEGSSPGPGGGRTTLFLVSSA